jgi:hypothetical protein
MKFKTNLSMNTAGFPPIPAGRYEVEIVEACLERALTGTEFINVDFRILHPAQQGRHVWTKLFLTEAASWRLAALLNAIGEPLTDDVETECWLGKRLIITVTVKDDAEGVERNEVQRFAKATASLP